MNIKTQKNQVAQWATIAHLRLKMPEINGM